MVQYFLYKHGISLGALPQQSAQSRGKFANFEVFFTQALDLRDAVNPLPHRKAVRTFFSSNRLRLMHSRESIDSSSVMAGVGVSNGRLAITMMIPLRFFAVSWIRQADLESILKPNRLETTTATTRPLSAAKAAPLGVVKDDDLKF